MSRTLFVAIAVAALLLAGILIFQSKAPGHRTVPETPDATLAAATAETASPTEFIVIPEPTGSNDLPYVPVE